MNAYEQSHMTLASKFFTSVLFVLVTMFFLPLLLHFSVTLKPIVKLAETGRLIIGSEDVNQGKTVALGGEWIFFDSRLVSPDSIQSVMPKARLVSGTGGWKLQGNGKNVVNGYATYHLNLSLEVNEDDLAIQIPQIETAYNLFINDTLVASAGVVSDVEKNAKAAYKPIIVQVPKGVDNFSITLQVSNYHSAWGGVWSPIILGKIDAIYRIKRDMVGLSMFIIGVMVITIAFYLIQFYFRPSDKIPLAFSILCLIFLCREFTAEHMYFVLSALGIGFGAIVKLNYFTFYSGLAAVICFMHLCFPEAFSRRISWGFYGVAVCFSLFVLFSPTRYIGYSLAIYQFICLLAMLYIIVCMVIAIKKKQPSAKMMMLGGIILNIFALNDMLYALGFVATGRFLSLGVIGFIISQSYVISNRFSNVMRHNEALSGQLQQRNTELQKLGSELETKVEQRTKQLELVNSELKNLASVDNLTGALNRHGLQQYLQAAFERSRRASEPSSIILFDFDNFKHVNDTYGHDRGDKVLALSAEVIQNMVREQDKLARWGGEEFLILLPNTDLQGAISIGDKLRLAISVQLSGVLDDNFPVTVTGGVAEMKSDETFDVLFKRADNALYKGKRLGRNCIQY